MSVRTEQRNKDIMIIVICKIMIETVSQGIIVTLHIRLIEFHRLIKLSRAVTTNDYDNCPKKQQDCPLMKNTLPSIGDLVTYKHLFRQHKLLAPM